MATPIIPIKQLKIQNLRCVYDATIDLDWFTVLIGKNDTGKSTILEAVYLLASASDPNRQPGLDENALVEMSSHSKGHLRVEATLSDLSTVSFGIEPTHARNRPSNSTSKTPLLARVAPPYRLSPSAMRVPTRNGHLQGGPLPPDGTALADVLDRMSRKTFVQKLLVELSHRVPSIEEVEVTTPVRDGYVEQGMKEIRFKLKNGDDIPARQASDGAMLILGYLAITMDNNPPPVILIEEPENGIHPAQLERLIQSLIELSSVQNRVQILMTTHSPYVLDAVGAENVRVVTRTSDEGTKVHKFTELEDVKRKLGAGYSVGEAFANMTYDASERLE